MGSKTNENEHNGGEDTPSPNGPCSAGGEPRGSHMARDGDGSLGSNGAGGDDDDDDDDEVHATSSVSLTDKKKRKKSKKSKKRKKASVTQSSPPRVPLHELFPSGSYPAGELCDYGAPLETTTRAKDPEKRVPAHRPLEDAAVLADYRKAAEVHRQVRRWVQDSVKPGQELTDIAVGIEDGVRTLLGNDGLETGANLRSGLAFPTGLSVNNCVAHYTPNPGREDIVLRNHDVMKVDFGVHVDGWIVDSAFTMSFDPVYDNLLAAVKDATNTGIKTAGIDVRISDVSAAIQEAMESYEVEIGGKVFPVKPVRDLCGHDIRRYRIHGTKAIPMVQNADQTKMREGEVFAVETFGSTGRGRLTDGPGIYGYGLNEGAPNRVSLPLASANRLYKTIRENFGSLVFCRRYLDRLGCDRYLAGLNSLVSHGVLESYQPLMDVPGSYSAQFEHTVLLRESQKEVISRGDDY